MGEKEDVIERFNEIKSVIEDLGKKYKETHIRVFGYKVKTILEIKNRVGSERPWIDGFFVSVHFLLCVPHVRSEFRGVANDIWIGIPSYLDAEGYKKYLDEYLLTDIKSRIDETFIKFIEQCYENKDSITSKEVYL